MLTTTNHPYHLSEALEIYRKTTHCFVETTKRHRPLFVAHLSTSISLVKIYTHHNPNQLSGGKLTTINTGKEDPSWPASSKGPLSAWLLFEPPVEYLQYI